MVTKPLADWLVAVTVETEQWSVARIPTIVYTEHAL